MLPYGLSITGPFTGKDDKGGSRGAGTKALAGRAPLLRDSDLRATGRASLQVSELRDGDDKGSLQDAGAKALTGRAPFYGALNYGTSFGRSLLYTALSLTG